MRVINTSWVLPALFASAAWTAGNAGEIESSLIVNKTETCPAAVFEKFCLGEASQALLERHKPRSSRTRDGKTQLAYMEKGGGVILTIENDTVVVVSKLISNASWEAYDKIVAGFEGKYGPGNNESQFPDYAKDVKAKESALRAGSGIRRHWWKQDQWKAVLEWRKVGGSDANILLVLKRPR